MKNTESPHQEIVHYLSEDTYVYQYKNLKVFNGLAEATVDKPAFIFSKEIGNHQDEIGCSLPSLMESSRSTYQTQKYTTHGNAYSYSHIARKILKIMILLVGIFVAVIFLIVYSAHRLEPTIYIPRADKLPGELESQTKEGLIIHSVVSDSTPLMSNRQY